MTTTYFLNAIMGNVFHSKTDPALPSSMYVGLSTTAPGLDGSNVTEPQTGGYARVEISNLSEPVDGEIYNQDSIEFPEATEDWGTVTHYVVFDSMSSGNLLMYEEFPSGRLIQAESQARFKPQSLKFSLNNPGGV